MIISRKQKSAIVEDVMNFKKADEKLTETVEETKKEEDLVEAVNVKPSEVLLQVELEKPKKHEGLIECADRKELAEKITELKEKKIKHKVSKQDGKYVIECFESTNKEEDKKQVKEAYLNMVDGDSVIEDLIDRAKDLVKEGHEASDAVSEAIDEGLIYTSDIISLLQHYGSIEDSKIIESYYDDLYSDVLNGLDVEESLKEDKKKLDLETAIKVADDTVLDDVLGKDTPERKLAGAIKDDKSENLEEAKSSVVDKIKSKVLHYLDKLGYNEQDFNDYFVIEEKEFVNDEGDKATHIQIRNDLVDYYEAEADGLMTQLDDLVAPGYFEPYDAYVWDAYIWEDDLKEDLSEVSLDDANIDEIEVDDADVNFNVEEVEDIVDDVVDAVGEEMKTKDAEEVDIDKIKDEVISDAVELKLDELDDDVSSFDEVEIVDTPDLNLDLVDDEQIVEEKKSVKEGYKKIVDGQTFWSVDGENWEECTPEEYEECGYEEVIEESKQEENTSEKLEEQISSDEDFSEEDAKFYENLNISNSYKNEFKSEEQQKLDEELGEVVIKDDLGVEEDMSEEDMKVFLGD